MSEKSGRTMVPLELEDLQRSSASLQTTIQSNALTLVVSGTAPLII